MTSTSSSNDACTSAKKLGSKPAPSVGDPAGVHLDTSDEESIGSEDLGDEPERIPSKETLEDSYGTLRESIRNETEYM